MQYTVTIEEITYTKLDVTTPDEDSAERMVLRMLESDLGITNSPGYERMPGEMNLTVEEVTHE